jgi:hypothetical protein
MIIKILNQINFKISGVDRNQNKKCSTFQLRILMYMLIAV